MRENGVGLNQASWNAVISGCVQSGRRELALTMLNEMKNSGFKPNQITIVSALPACTNTESINCGKQIHGYAFRHRFVEDITIGTALVLLYAKCGELELAGAVFDMMPRKDVVAWNTMIFSNSMHGNGEEALRLFYEMLHSGVKLNSVTFIGVFSGCSHSQLVDESILIFNSMSSKYSITPDGDHYSCMVDVLSRAGRLKQAYEFIQKMPMEPSAAAWGALLGACRVYKNVELAKIAATRLFEVEPDNSGNYALYFNILVSAKMWDEASETRKRMRDKGITKTPGRSWIEVKNRIHSFAVGEEQQTE